VRDWLSGRVVEDVGFAMAVISVLGHLRREAAQFMHFCICGTGCLIMCVVYTVYGYNHGLYTQVRNISPGGVVSLRNACTQYK
jgi:hypothetical protein